MSKFPQTDHERYEEHKIIAKKVHRFALAGTVFLAFFFAVAAWINVTSMPITLTSLSLAIIVGVAWVYWFVSKGWAIYYRSKVEKD